MGIFYREPNKVTKIEPCNKEHDLQFEIQKSAEMSNMFLFVFYLKLITVFNKV